MPVDRTDPDFKTTPEVAPDRGEQPREPDGNGQAIIDPPIPVEVRTGDHSQAIVLNRALDIYKERNATRHDAWMDAGAIGNLVEMRKKLDRLWAAWDDPQEKDVDEALDLINAAVFWIRCAEMGNINGGWPWPDARR